MATFRPCNWWHRVSETAHTLACWSLQLASLPGSLLLCATPVQHRRSTQRAHIAQRCCIRTLLRLTFGPRVVWTASASMSTPRSIAARASVPNAISLPVAKPRLTHWCPALRPSSWSLVESISTAGKQPLHRRHTAAGTKGWLVRCAASTLQPGGRSRRWQAQSFCQSSPAESCDRDDRAFVWRLRSLGVPSARAGSPRLLRKSVDRNAILFVLRRLA